MADDATERHNQMAPEIIKHVIYGTNGDLEDALVVLESVVLGVISYHAINSYRPGPLRYRAASEYLDLLTQRVIERFSIMDGLGQGSG